MKILFVLENYYPNVGGVETLFKNLVESLADRGHQIKIITTRLDPSHPFKEELPNLTIYRYGFRNRYAFTFLALFPILKHISDVDLVHTTSYNAAFPAFLASKLRSKKIIVTFHEVWGKLWFKLPFMNAFTRIGHSLFEGMLLKFPFHKLVAVSESTAERLRENGIKEEKIEVILNGIDYDLWSPVKHSSTEDKPFTYTYYGRLGISKGLDILIKAADIIRMNHPDSRFKMIIPTVPENLFKEISQLIERYKLSDYIEMLHELDIAQLKEEISSSDCVVIPSYSEGFCFAAAETSALGIPIVSSHRTALKETVSGKYIAMESMDVPSLVNAIEKAKKNDWSVTEPKRFPLKETTEKYLELYQQIENS